MPSTAPDHGVCELRLVHEAQIRPTPPYHLTATVLKPSHFPSRNVALEGDVWYQAMVFRSVPLGITLQADGGVEDSLVRCAVYAEHDLDAEFVEALLQEIIHRYGMAVDLRPFYARFASDDLLGPVLQRWRGMQVSTSASLYEFMITTVVLQNATVHRTVQMMDNLITHYGHAVAFVGHQMGALGSPADLDRATEEDLRALKLGYRARTIRRLTSLFVSGQIDESELRRLDTETLRKRLLTIYGIGPASVWYLLFEVFHRYDAFQHISPWEQKIFSRILFDREMVEAGRILDEVEKRWAGWRMLAAHYLFEDLFWQRRGGSGPQWLDELIRL